MTALTIRLESDPYGKFARASALADYLETIATRNITALRTDLELSISRGGWYRAHRGLFTSDPDVDLSNIEALEAEDGTEDPDDPDWSDWALALTRQRKQVLGDLYPFDVDDDGIHVHGAWESSDYGRLLVLSMAHAHRAHLRVDPRAIFERLLVDAFSAMGFSSVGMGTATTRGKKFPQQLAAAANAVGMTSMTVPFPARTYAKDGGVDAIGVLNWRDNRPGQLVLIAQATLASSLRWEQKIAEPKPHHWVDYLQEVLHPVGVLAVPYHIEDEQFRYLLRDHATIFDRLRLSGRLGRRLDGETDAYKWFMFSTLDY